MPGGRPSKYKPEFAEMLEAFFDIEPYRSFTATITHPDGRKETKRQEVANKIPLLVDFAKEVGVSTSTLRDWASKRDGKTEQLIHPEFSAAYKKVIEYQEKYLVVNGLKGLVNTTFAIFAAKNMVKWRDKREEEHTGSQTFKVVYESKNPEPQPDSIPLSGTREQR